MGGCHVKAIGDADPVGGVDKVDSSERFPIRNAQMFAAVSVVQPVNTTTAWRPWVGALHTPHIGIGIAPPLNGIGRPEG